MRKKSQDDVARQNGRIMSSEGRGDWRDTYNNADDTRLGALDCIIANECAKAHYGA